MALFGMMKDCNWCNQFYRGRFGSFTIIKGCGPVTHCGKGLIVALYGIRSPKALCGERLIVILHDVCGQLPLWQGAHCCTQPSHHHWQQFAVPLFSKGLIVALLNKCGQLGILTVRALGIVHAIFSVLVVFALGNVHAFSNVLAKPNLACLRCWL